MQNQELIDYIKKAKEAGQNDEQIKNDLLKVGWEEEDIKKGFKKTKIIKLYYVGYFVSFISLFALVIGILFPNFPYIKGLFSSSFLLSICVIVIISIYAGKFNPLFPLYIFFLVIFIFHFLPQTYRDIFGGFFGIIATPLILIYIFYLIRYTRTKQPTSNFNLKNDLKDQIIKKKEGFLKRNWSLSLQFLHLLFFGYVGLAFFTELFSLTAEYMSAQERLHTTIYIWFYFISGILGIISCNLISRKRKIGYYIMTFLVSAIILFTILLIQYSFSYYNLFSIVPVIFGLTALILLINLLHANNKTKEVDLSWRLMSATIFLSILIMSILYLFNFKNKIIQKINQEQKISQPISPPSTSQRPEVKTPVSDQQIYKNEYLEITNLLKDMELHIGSNFVVHWKNNKDNFDLPVDIALIDPSGKTLGLLLFYDTPANQEALSWKVGNYYPKPYTQVAEIAPTGNGYKLEIRLISKDGVLITNYRTESFSIIN